MFKDQIKQRVQVFASDHPVLSYTSHHDQRHKESGNQAVHHWHQAKQKGRNTSSTTSSARPSGRSILLIITIGFKPCLSALPKNEFCLWHRAFGGIGQQNNAVRHMQHALHLTAEIGVTGGINNVDPRIFPHESMLVLPKS